jgi:D-3-phosphoglycerate dehydrogenase
MYKVLTLNNIAVEGLRRLPRNMYETGSGITTPDAVILRSFNMHDMDIPESVAAIARAGAGVNNIPIEAMSARGVPVFNAPGASRFRDARWVLLGSVQSVWKLPM